MVGGVDPQRTSTLERTCTCRLELDHACAPNPCLAGLGVPRARRRPGTGLFATGVLFAYFVVLPAATTFLTNFDDSLYDIQIRASYYLSFTSFVLIACGLAFEMPIFILALVRIRVLSYDNLRRNRKIGYALMVAFANLLPTVDPVSLLLEAIHSSSSSKHRFSSRGLWKGGSSSTTKTCLRCLRVRDCAVSRADDNKR